MAHVLLVEDDPDTAEAMEGMLRALGHEVTLAGNGREAVRLAKAGFTPSLVLTDIVMPEMDGLEMLQTFKVMMADTPIVAMTALKGTPYLRSAEMFGARETLAKPFTLEQLKQTLGRVLH